MNCPKCGNLLTEGFIYLASGHTGSWLLWSEQEPGVWQWKKKDSENLLLQGAMLRTKKGKEKCLRRAHYCEPCSMYCFVGESQ